MQNAERQALAILAAARQLLASDRSDQDMQDAVEYYMEVEQDERKPSRVCFTTTSQSMPLKQLLTWDDYSSWGDLSPGELRDASPEEAKAALADFRGPEWADRALGWVKSGTMPPIILVWDGKTSCIADGRGRTNVAVAFVLDPVNVTILTKDTKGDLCFNYENFHVVRASLTRSPGVEFPPVGINPAAQDVWCDILRRYSNMIFKGRSIAAEWAAALQVFERACAARGIKPFLSR